MKYKFCWNKSQHQYSGTNLKAVFATFLLFVPSSSFLHEKTLKYTTADRRDTVSILYKPPGLNNLKNSRTLRKMLLNE